MLFPTLAFAAFFAVVMPVSWLLMRHRVQWRLFMVAASWFFYGSADWRFVPLLAGSTVVNHFFARRIHSAAADQGGSQRRRWWTIGAVATNLAVLGWFKYIGFLSLSAHSALRFLGVGWAPPLPEVLLPIGISFFTFQALSYVIDTGRGKVKPVSLLEFAVYLSFFPHLVAGPIVRASEFLPQIKDRIRPRVDISKAFWLISMGLFKKVVIASYLGTYAADPLFGFPHQHAGVEAAFGVYAYAIQIYADFSGYTDIAIGLALLLGIEFPQNFNAPYAAASLQDFWRRWHMTLSRWLRDYLYIPLGGSRRGRFRTWVNVMITMLLGGLWHGAAWTFVAWGALHGTGLVVERLIGERHRTRSGDRPGPGNLASSAGPVDGGGSGGLEEPGPLGGSALGAGSEGEAASASAVVRPKPWAGLSARSVAAFSRRPRTATEERDVGEPVSVAVLAEDGTASGSEGSLSPSEGSDGSAANDRPASSEWPASSDRPAGSEWPASSDRPAGSEWAAGSNGAPRLGETGPSDPSGGTTGIGGGAWGGGPSATGYPTAFQRQRWPEVSVTRTPAIKTKRETSPAVRLWIGRIITFHLVCLAWIFFRATSFHNAVEVLGRIGSLGGRHQALNWKVVVVVVAALAVQLGPRGLGARLQASFSNMSWWAQALALAGMLTVIDLLGPAGIAPFIYFRF